MKGKVALTALVLVVGLLIGFGLWRVVSGSSHDSGVATPPAASSQASTPDQTGSMPPSASAAPPSDSAAPSTSESETTVPSDQPLPGQPNDPDATNRQNQESALAFAENFFSGKTDGWREALRPYVTDRLYAELAYVDPNRVPTAQVGSVFLVSRQSRGSLIDVYTTDMRSLRMQFIPDGGGEWKIDRYDGKDL